MAPESGGFRIIENYRNSIDVEFFGCVVWDGWLQNHVFDRILLASIMCDGGRKL